VNADDVVTSIDNGISPDPGAGEDTDREGSEPYSKSIAGYLRNGPISFRSVLLICLAVGVVVGSIALSQNSVTANNPDFIQLWMVPQPLADGANATAAQVGVQNTRTTSIDIVVHVTEGSHLVFSKSLPNLAPGGTWTRSFDRAVSQKLVATVSYASQPTKIVRNVYLQSPAT
jgi:hypothetical protein